MNFIKKTIKVTFITIVLLFLLLYFSFYTIAFIAPRISMIMASEKYISENYKTATIIKRRYQPEIAFIIPYGTYDITLNQDGYEFEIELSAYFLDKPDIIDYYGSYHKLDDIKANKIKNYIINHELFKKYNYDKSNIKIETLDEEEFVTKEKVDENTFEIISIDIENEFYDKDILFLNNMESKEKHEFLNDIYNFLKSENLKIQKLELNFMDPVEQTDSYQKLSTKETLNICSDEFIKYEKINDFNFNEKHEREKNMLDTIKNIKINGWIIEDIILERYDTRLLLKNKDRDEQNLYNDLKILFKSLDNMFKEKNIEDNIVLALNYNNHKANEFHYIYYYR